MDVVKNSTQGARDRRLRVASLATRNSGGGGVGGAYTQAKFDKIMTSWNLEKQAKTVASKN